MRHRAVSIEDIARIAGVSHSTVSRALRDSTLISADVRAHIRQLALDMGYIPNAIAQSLQTQRTNTIGLVVTTLADPFWADVVKGVEQVAQTAGISVFLSTSHRDPEHERAVIETFHRRRVDGVLVADARLSEQYAERLAQIHMPTVLLNSQIERSFAQLHSVAVDDYQGARTAVEHLLQLGHRAIGYLGSAIRPRSNARRLAGYRDALATAGLPSDSAWAIVPSAGATSDDDEVAAGCRLARELLQTGVSAIFCYNDMLAIGVLTACREQGMRVPHDLSLVGFDDIQMAQYMTPALTTIQQPKERLGELGMQMLLDVLAERPVHDQVVVPILMQRASTAEKAENGKLKTTTDD